MAQKTAPKPERAKPGPKPKLEHSKELIEQLRALGGIQATVEECAAVLRVSLRTLQNFFLMHEDAKLAHEDGKLTGLMSLRRKQFSMADKNASMAIWLGKQYLGQREPITQIETGKPGDFDNMTLPELTEYIATGLQEYSPEERAQLLKLANASKGAKDRATKH